MGFSRSIGILPITTWGAKGGANTNSAHSVHPVGSGESGHWKWCETWRRTKLKSNRSGWLLPHHSPLSRGRGAYVQARFKLSGKRCRYTRHACKFRYFESPTVSDLIWRRRATDHRHARRVQCLLLPVWVALWNWGARIDEVDEKKQDFWNLI